MPTSAPRAVSVAASVLGMQRAATRVDVHAVGIDADRDDLRAQLLEQVGPDLVGGAVGAVDRRF